MTRARFAVGDVVTVRNDMIKSGLLYGVVIEIDGEVASIEGQFNKRPFRQWYHHTELRKLTRRQAALYMAERAFNLSSA